MEQGTNRRSSHKNTKKHKGTFKKFLLGLLIALILIASAGAGAALAIIKSAPAIDTDIIGNLSQSSKIYDMNGNFIEDFSAVENRNIVKLNNIPKNLQNAFISIEDQRFRIHHGIDIKRIISSLWYDLRTMSKGQGASTITQQLVKNYALTQKKAWSRKIQEAYLAIQLERKMSKDQILEAYLNTIFLGNNAYGVQSASQVYFGKDVSKLTIAEDALIAGLTQNPTKYNPYSKKNVQDPSTYIDRQRTVLAKMRELGYINETQYNEAISEKLVFQSKKSVSTMKYQWFIEPAIDEIAKDFEQKYNIDESEAKQKLRTGGYNIYLTIDTNIQNIVQNTIDDSKYYKGLKVPNGLSTYSADGKSKAVSEPQAAAVVFDYRNGEVKAIVGGRGQHDLLSLNRATDVARQPGSSIKPLAVYGPAIDSEIATAGTVIEDSPMPQDFVNANHGWDPKNSDGAFHGYTTIRNGIKNSVNLVAVKLEQMVGINKSVNYLEDKFHITTLKSDDKNIAALALGGMTNGVTPYEMAAAYGVFGNGGVYSSPIMYTKVTDKNGDSILEKTSEQSKSISSQAAYIMTDMLKGVVSGGTATNARLGAMPAAGKTGTASDNTNAWFCGFTPYYSGAVWLGHDQPRVKVSGLKSSLAAKMWGDIMKQAHKDLEVKDFDRPSGLVTAQICLDSGKAPSELCSKDPRGSRVVNDIFIDGTQPVEICDVHVEAQIDKLTGKLAAPNCPLEDIVTKVFIKRTTKERAALSDDKYVLPTEYSTLHSGQSTDIPTATP